MRFAGRLPRRALRLAAAAPVLVVGLALVAEPVLAGDSPLFNLTETGTAFTITASVPAGTPLTDSVLLISEPSDTVSIGTLAIVDGELIYEPVPLSTLESSSDGQVFWSQSGSLASEPANQGWVIDLYSDPTEAPIATDSADLNVPQSLASPAPTATAPPTPASAPAGASSAKPKTRTADKSSRLASPAVSPRAAATATVPPSPAPSPSASRSPAASPPPPMPPPRGGGGKDTDLLWMACALACAALTGTGIWLMWD